MPSPSRQKSKAKPTSRPSRPTRPAAAKKGAPAKAKPKPKPAPAAKAPGAKSAPSASAKSSPKAPAPELEVPSPDGRKHLLSLSFVRDGDEFMARLETDVGHITELKNRSLDQLLTLVASELEDLLE